MSTICILYLIYRLKFIDFLFLPFSFTIYDSVVFVNGPFSCVLGCFWFKVNKADGNVWISLVDFFAIGFVVVISVVIVVGFVVVISVVVVVVRFAVVSGMYT